MFANTLPLIVSLFIRPAAWRPSGRFVNRGHQRATILLCLFHGAFPQLLCDVASLARCARLRVVGFRSTRRRVWTNARRTALIRVW